MFLVYLSVKLNYFLSFLVNGRYDDLPRPGKVPHIVAERFKVILLLALSSLFWVGGGLEGGHLIFSYLLCPLLVPGYYSSYVNEVSEEVH